MTVKKRIEGLEELVRNAKGESRTDEEIEAMDVAIEEAERKAYERLKRIGLR